MKLSAPLSKKSPKTIRTEIFHYEIPGYNPERIVLEETVTYVNEIKKSHSYELKDLNPRKDYWPIFVEDQFFNEIKTKNPFGYDKIIHRIDSDYYKFDASKINSDWKIIWCSHCNHTMMDEDDVPIPYAKWYHYCMAPFSSERIYLNGVFLDFLRNHPWVVNKDALEITKIPYYNNNSGKETTVEVQLLPDLETYQEIVKASKKHGKNTWGHKVDDYITGYVCCFDKDAKDYFGIRPFLKNS